MSDSRKSQLAVALHYDRTGAPRVVAKGKGTLGEKIIEVAKANNIPIEENEVLAGALSNVELGEEIPTVKDGERRSSEEVMLDVNKAFEAAIRRDPANWFWVHKRWKLQASKGQSPKARDDEVRAPVEKGAMS